jgi:hypothetical protein
MGFYQRRANRVGLDKELLPEYSHKYSLRYWYQYSNQ